MPYSEGAAWLGIGFKVGGMAILVGAENTEGVVFNIANTSTRAAFRVQSARLGLGLGGGAGLVAACVFNCADISRLNGTSTGWDWSVGLSLGGNWAGVARALRNRRFFATIARIGVGLRFSPGDIDTLKNCMSMLYTTYDVGSTGQDPKVILIDIPVGEGLEASISFSRGTIEIDSVRNMQRGVR